MIKRYIGLWDYVALAALWLIFVLFLAHGCGAHGQTLSGNLIYLKPSSLTTTCRDGDLRVDLGSSPIALKMCASNVWNEISGAIESLGDIGDVDLSTPPITGQALVWDTDHWEAGTVIPQDAVADGVTKGVATFTATDFNSASGVISIDYTNGQAASDGAKGFLTSADWSTFNSKESALTFNSPLTRSTNTISIQNSAADGSTKGAASFTANDFDASSGNISIDYTNGQAASGSTKGFLTSADWTTFNNKQASGNYITALTGEVTASGPGSVAATVSTTAVTGKALTGYSISSGIVAATDTILQAFQKLAGNVRLALENSVFPNKLANGDFEYGATTGWTASGGTFAINSSSPSVGTYDGTWDSSSASQTLDTPSITIDAALANKNAALVCLIKVPSGTATHTITVNDGTNDLAAARTITNTTSGVYEVVNFIAPAAGGTVKGRITSVASNEPSITVDECKIASAYGVNVGTAAQTIFIGSAYIPGTASCEWQTTATTLTAFGTDTDCPGPTVESNPGPGVIQTTDTNLPRFTVNSLPPGTYRVRIHGARPTNSSTSVFSCFAVTDGTTMGADRHCDSMNASGGISLDVEGWFTYTTAGDRSFSMAGATTGATTAAITNSDTKTALHFSITRYPLASQQVYTTDQSDYGWTQYTPTFTGFGTVNTHSMYHMRIGDTLYLRGRFTAGTPSATEARISLPGTLTSVSTIATLEMVGKYTLNAVQSSDQIVLIEPSTGYITFGRQDGTTGGLSKLNGSTIIGTGNAMSITAAIPITGWQVSNRAPQLVNSIVSNYDGVLREINALVNGTGTPAITRQTGTAFGTITDNGTGDWTLAIASGTFSATPYCQVTGYIGTAHRFCYISQDTAISTTSVRVECANDGGVAVDESFFISCKGAP